MLQIGNTGLLIWKPGAELLPGGRIIKPLIDFWLGNHYI